MAPKLDKVTEQRMKDMSNNRKSEEGLMEMRNTMDMPNVPPPESGGPTFTRQVETEGPPQPPGYNRSPPFSPGPTDSSHPRVRDAVKNLDLESPPDGKKPYKGAE
jgi:hypothetical protein